MILKLVKILYILFFYSFIIFLIKPKMNESDDNNMNYNFLEKDIKEIQNQDERTPLKEKILAENKKEKSNLLSVLQTIESKLNDEINKNEENENDKDEEEKIDKTKIETNILIAFIENRRKKSYIWLLWGIFSIFLPFFTAINLIGIFQIISVMNALYEALKRSIVCYLDWENKEDKSYYEFYNFYSYYFKESINEGIEFDLIETMGFLGTIFVKFYGFRISSFIFMIVNGLSLFLIMNFFSQYNDTFEKFSLFQILYLFFCYILLFIGVGSSALLSQQLLIDNYEKYSSFLKQVEKLDNKDEKKEEKKNKNEKEEEKQNIPYFILICLTSIIGFLFKYFFDVVISINKNKFDQKYNITEIIDFNNNFTNNNFTDNEINNIIFSHDKLLFIFIIIIYGVSISISIGFYHCFKNVYENEEIEEKEEKDDSKNCQIFGYIFYLKKIKNNKNEEQLEQEEQLESKESKDTVTEVVLAGSYRKKKEKIKEKKKIFKRTYIWIRKYCLLLFLNLKLLSDSFKSCFDEIVCNYFCCGKKSLCCCCLCCECCECNCCTCCECCNVCIKKVKEEDYEQNEGYFCYCYKSKKNLKWFNRFIRDDTQIKFLPLLIEYFLIKLNTIAFETIIDENNEEGNNEFIKDFISIFKFIMIFTVSLFLFFYLTISFGRIYIYITEDKNQEDEKSEINKLGAYTGKLSNKILNGTNGIIIFNSFYSFFVSLICLSKDINNNFCFYIPILMNKFFFFAFAHHCTVFTDTEEGIDFFSCGTLLAIYLQVLDFIIDLLKKFPIKILLYIQVIFSSFIILASLSLISLFMCFLGMFWLTFLYLLSFLFSFDGFWFYDCYKKNKCDEYK